MVAELLDRSRRIETRVTKIGIALGVDVGGGKPVWGEGKIILPTPNCSVGECLAIVPQEWNLADPVALYVGDEYLVSLVAQLGGVS